MTVAFRGNKSGQQTVRPTAQLGKCHEVPTWEWSPAGPFERRPTGSGFEYFYGFIGGETSQFYPNRDRAARRRFQRVRRPE